MTFVEFRRELNIRYGLRNPWPRELQVDPHTYNELILQFIKAGIPPPDETQVLTYKNIRIIKNNLLNSPWFTGGDNDESYK